MAMYYYASKISAIACGTRCRKTVLKKSRGQRDRDKYFASDDDITTGDDYSDDNGGNDYGDNENDNCSGSNIKSSFDVAISVSGVDNAENMGTFVVAPVPTTTIVAGRCIRHRRKHSEQLDSLRLQEFQSTFLGFGGIMYINGRIMSGPLDTLIKALVPKNCFQFDKEFIFSFLLSSRLFLHPHELLDKLLTVVPDSQSLESLVALLAEWTQKFPYDYRDERMMDHVKHIVSRFVKYYRINKPAFQYLLDILISNTQQPKKALQSLRL